MNRAAQALNGKVTELGERMRVAERKLGALYTPFQASLFEIARQNEGIPPAVAAPRAPPTAARVRRR